MDTSTLVPMFSTFELFANIFASFDGLIDDWLDKALGNTITTIVDVARLLLMIYVVLWGFAMVRGLIDEPITDGLARFLKLSIIVGLALNVDLYRTFIVDTVQEVPMNLAFVLSGGTDAELTDPDSPFQYGMIMDSQMVKVIDMSRRIGNEASLLRAGLKWHFLSLITLIFGSLIFIISALLIVMATVSLAVLLAVGPVFLLFAIFEKTNGLFEGWLRQTLMFMARLFFVVLIAGLFFQIMAEFIDAADEHMALQNVYLAGISVAVVSLTLCLLLAQTSELASGITGGVAVSASSGAAKLLRGAATGRVLGASGLGAGRGAAGARNIVSATRRRF